MKRLQRSTAHATGSALAAEGAHATATSHVTTADATIAATNAAHTAGTNAFHTATATTATTATATTSAEARLLVGWRRLLSGYDYSHEEHPAVDLTQHLDLGVAQRYLHLVPHRQRLPETPGRVHGLDVGDSCPTALPRAPEGRRGRHLGQARSRANAPRHTAHDRHASDEWKQRRERDAGDAERDAQGVGTDPVRSAVIATFDTLIDASDTPGGAAARGGVQQQAGTEGPRGRQQPGELRGAESVEPLRDGDKERAAAIMVVAKYRGG